jgi:hypothetical protein
LVRHREALQGLFFDVLALCQRAGLVNVRTVAVDSTKLAANASADQNRTYEALRKEAERIIEEAIATDAREDELYGEKRGDELPEELADPRTRKARIGELLEQVRREQEQAKAEREERVARHAEHRARTGKRLPGAQFKPEVTRRERVIQNKKYNLTDPDSGIVRHRGMRMQGYNVQAAVADGQVILATSVSRVSPDGGQLAPTIELARENLDRCGITAAVEQVLADAGYWQTKQITELKQTGLDVLVAPQIKTTSIERANQEVQAMAARLQSDEGKAAYRRRQQIVEPVFAHIKHIRGITRVLRRGKTAVQAEIDLIATTHNLLKLFHAAHTAA